MDKIDYKDVNLLKNHIGETCKITPSRATNTRGLFQRRIAIEIKRARLLALIPYTDRHQL